MVRMRLRRETSRKMGHREMIFIYGYSAAAEYGEKSQLPTRLSRGSQNACSRHAPVAVQRRARPRNAAVAQRPAPDGKHGSRKCVPRSRFALTAFETKAVLCGTPTIRGRRFHLRQAPLFPTHLGSGPARADAGAATIAVSECIAH